MTRCALSEVVKIISNDRFPFPREKCSAYVDNLNSGETVVDVSEGYSCTAKS